MNPFEVDQQDYTGNEPRRSRSGFTLAVLIILLFLGFIIFGFLRSYVQITDAANAKLFFMVAVAKAMEFEATGNYHVPEQRDLINLIGEDINQDAVIHVVDEEKMPPLTIIFISKMVWKPDTPGNLNVKKLQ